MHGIDDARRGHAGRRAWNHHQSQRIHDGADHRSALQQRELGRQILVAASAEAKVAGHQFTEGAEFVLHEGRRVDRRSPNEHHGMPVESRRSEHKNSPAINAPDDADGDDCARRRTASATTRRSMTTERALPSSRHRVDQGEQHPESRNDGKIFRFNHGSRSIHRTSPSE